MGDEYRTFNVGKRDLLTTEVAPSAPIKTRVRISFRPSSFSIIRSHPRSSCETAATLVLSFIFTPSFAASSFIHESRSFLQAIGVRHSMTRVGTPGTCTMCPDKCPGSISTPRGISPNSSWMMLFAHSPMTIPVHTLSRGNLFFSKMSVLKPFCAHFIAAADPPGPAPTTITSNFSGLGVIVLSHPLISESSRRYPHIVRGNL